jgi:L-asparaginase II
MSSSSTGDSPSQPGCDMLLAEVTRGSTVESRHFGAAVLTRATGVLESFGDVRRLAFPRSAIKPIQALQLVETGAAARFGIGDREIALACSSHSGESMHVDLAASWLGRLGLDVRALRCGTHWPLSEVARNRLVAAGHAPSALHNNCSGKHVGFLNVALHMDETLDDYVTRDHPTQLRWLEALQELANETLDPDLAGIDGCAIPSQPLSLAGIAMAMSRFASSKATGAVRAGAMQRINAAIAGHPALVAGTDRICTRIIAATGGRVLAKTGAEGVYVAWIPEEQAAVALKIADGATRAAEVTVAALLQRVLGSRHPLAGVLEQFTQQAIVSAAGAPAGMVRSAAALAAAQRPA